MLRPPRPPAARSANGGAGSGRLVTRLSLSHSVPVLLVALALALLLAAMVRVSVVLTALDESELGALRDEGALHRAMWDLDVAMRHAHDDCKDGYINPAAREKIEQCVAVLSATTQVAPAEAAMLPLAEEYLVLARDLDAAPVCDVLHGAATHSRREQLDESLTNLWVTRLQVLHDAVKAKEQEARAIGMSATWMGLTLTLASILLALLVARRMARSLSRPLESLAELARRVGVEDFQTPIAVDGPFEIRLLGDELERMRQRLAQLDALKQGFLASVSHELRTPLSKIREALALLGDGVVGPLDARQARVLGIARQACEREIRMVSTLLDLSRLRSGNPLRPREGSAIDKIIESAILDEQSEADSRGVHVESRKDAEVPHCRLDPVLLERAIANLIRNAVAVSRRGQRVVVARRLREPTAQHPGGRIEIIISDEGPGVPEAIRKIVFEAFVTHGVPQSGKTLGVGLGLALAREIALVHGGDLLLEESATPGATFRLWLPIETGDARHATDVLGP